MTVVDAVVSRTPRWAIDVLRSAKSRVRRVRARRRFGPLISLVAPDSTDRELIVALDDSAVFRIGSSTGDSVILKLASSDIASTQLRIEATALRQIHDLPDRGDAASATPVADVTAEGTTEGVAWFTQTLLGGVTVSTVDLPAVHLVTAATEALDPIHRATSETVEITPDQCAALIDDPIDTIEHWRPASTNGLEIARSRLTDALAGRSLTLGRNHGDFAPSNVMWDPINAAVSGIIDWNFDDHLLLPEIDTVHFAISLLAQRRRAEYGHVVVDALDSPAADELGACVRAAVDAGPNCLDPATAVLLAWTQHVAFGLYKAADLRVNPIWLSNNIDHVAGHLATSSRPVR